MSILGIRPGRFYRLKAAAVGFILLLFFLGVVMMAIGGSPLAGMKLRDNHDAFMSPALKPRYGILIFLWAYWFSPPRTGDVIMCEMPESPSMLLIRVAPCTGKERHMSYYAAWVSEDPDLPYLCATFDNPPETFTDATWKIPTASVRGKVKYIFYPLSAAGAVPPRAEGGQAAAEGGRGVARLIREDDFGPATHGIDLVLGVFRLFGGRCL